MKHEKRVTEIINSLEGIHKAKAPRDGFAKIQQKLADQRNKQPQIKQQSGYGWLKIAAVIALVISSNIWAVSNYLVSESICSEVADNYPQIVSNFDIYENE